jgi:hypothetical protein
LRVPFFCLSLRGAKRRSNLAFPPEVPLRLLRFARNDRRGRHWEGLFCLVLAGSLFSGIGGLFCLSLRGAKRRSNLAFPSGGP